MFKSKMVTPAIPERVFALCKIVENEQASNSEIKAAMEPKGLNKATSYYSDYRQAAEELGLISVNDNIVSLVVDKSVIETPSTMRKYINTKLHSMPEGQFFRVTKAYYNMDSDVLRGEKNVANLATKMSELTGMSIDNKAMHGWRFWMTFLGFGYLHEMFLIPNADVFLQDIIECSELQKGKMYSVSEFLEALRPYSDIIIEPDYTKHLLGFGVSNGIRVLAEKGIIECRNIMDQAETWNLYHIDELHESERVTNITIL